VGEDNFRWEVAPVCACLESFAWNNETVQPKIDDDGRKAHFLELVKSYCA
jgi:hypothetical protein